MKRLLLALLLTATALAQPPTPPAPPPAPETKNATLTRLAEEFTVRARVARNLARIIATKEASVAFNLSAESYERAAELCRRSIDQIQVADHLKITGSQVKSTEARK